LLLSFEIFEVISEATVIIFISITFSSKICPTWAFFSWRLLEGPLKCAPTSFLIKRRGTAFLLILHFSLLKFHFKPLLKYRFQSLMICVSVIKTSSFMCRECYDVAWQIVFSDLWKKNIFELVHTKRADWKPMFHWWCLVIKYLVILSKFELVKNFEINWKI